MNRKLKPLELSCTISQTRVLLITYTYILYVIYMYIAYKHKIFIHLYIHIQNLEAPSNRTPPNEHIPTMHGQLKTPWCFFFARF